MNMNLYENRTFLLTVLKELESLDFKQIYRSILFIYTFIFRLSQRSFRLRKLQYFYGNLYEIEKILTITQYFYENVCEIPGTLTIYIT